MIKKTMIDSLAKNSIYDIREILCPELSAALKDSRDIVILCIGTDRSTGDSLGPLVGDKLKFLMRSNVFLYGGLKNPVHAKNLVETLNIISSQHKNPFIIAVDASLGCIDDVGKVIIESKPLNPGSALNKNLPSVGDLYITGIVNISGSLEFMVLQNTRLYVVMTLADCISSGIYHAILKTVGGRHNYSQINSDIDINKTIDME